MFAMSVPNVVRVALVLVGAFAFRFRLGGVFFRLGIVVNGRSLDFPLG